MKAAGLSNMGNEDADREEFKRAFDAYAKAHDAERNGATPEEAKAIVQSHLDGKEAVLHEMGTPKKAKTIAMTPDDFTSADLDDVDVVVKPVAASKTVKPKANSKAVPKGAPRNEVALKRAEAKIHAMTLDMDDLIRENKGLNIRLQGYGREMNRMEEMVSSLANPTGAEARYFNQMAQNDPKFAHVLDQRLAKLSALEQRLDALSRAEAERTSRESIMSEKEKVRRVFPNWEDIVGAPAFLKWVQGQNASVKRMVNSTDGDDLITVLELFDASSRVDPDKAEANLRKKMRRDMQMNAATRVPRGGLDAQSEIPDDFAAAFNYYAKKHDEERKKNGL